MTFPPSAIISTSEATGVSEWVEQHIHPLSSRLVQLSGNFTRDEIAIMIRLTEVMSIADQLSKVLKILQPSLGAMKKHFNLQCHVQTRSKELTCRWQPGQDDQCSLPEPPLSPVLPIICSCSIKCKYIHLCNHATWPNLHKEIYQFVLETFQFQPDVWMCHGVFDWKPTRATNVEIDLSQGHWGSKGIYWCRRETA